MSARFSSQPPPINAQPISYYPYTYGSSGMPGAFLQQQPSPSVSRPVSSSSVQSHPWKPVQAQATFLQAPPSQTSQPSLSIRVPGLSLSPAEHEMDEFSLGGQMTPRSMTDLSAQCSPHKILVRTSDNGQSGRASGFNRGMAHYREHSFAYSSTAFTSANTLITPPLTPGFSKFSGFPSKNPVLMLCCLFSSHFSLWKDTLLWIQAVPNATRTAVHNSGIQNPQLGLANRLSPI